MDWVDQGIEDYYNLMKERTYKIRDDVTGWSVISTPFIGAFNDNIELFVKLKHSDTKIVEFSDDGQTVNNLKMQGVSFTSSNKRKELLNKILNNYGLKLENDEIITECKIEKFASVKFNIISAIIEINNFSLMSRSNIHSMFKEDVDNYLNEIEEIIVTREMMFKGKTGLEFTFDWFIAHKDKEIVIKAYNQLNKSNIPHFLFIWDDVKEYRENQSKKKLEALIFVNDVGENKEPKKELLEALESRKANTILWTKRHSEENKNKIVA